MGTRQSLEVRHHRDAVARGASEEVVRVIGAADGAGAAGRPARRHALLEDDGLHSSRGKVEGGRGSVDPRTDNRDLVGAHGPQVYGGGGRPAGPAAASTPDLYTAKPVGEL